MASTSYTKKTWKGRLGTDLDKYTIGPVDLNGRQKITPYTGGVTQQGDPLSAGNLNDLEGRIDTAFESVEGAISSEATTRGNADNALDAEITKIKNGATIVEKAKKDEDGNNIKATYATKTAFSEEETARETADTNEQNARIAKDNDLQSQIVNTNVVLQQKVTSLQKQIDNITEAEDLIETVDYSNGENAVPANVSKYAEVSMLRGRTRPWNQLANPSALISDGTFYNVIISVDTGTNTITLSGTSTGATFILILGASQPDAVVGHVYLVMGNRSTAGIRWGSEIVSGDFIRTATSLTDLQLAIRLYQGSSYSGSIQLHIHDLTLIFGAGNEPSTVAEAVALLSALGEYNAYDAGSLVDTTYSAVKSVGVNIWDEEWESGRWDNNTGLPSVDNDRIRNKYPIKVNPSTTYYKGTTLISNCYFYDSDMNFLSYGGAGEATVTTPANCVYMNFMTIVGNPTYSHNIQICLDSYSDKTNFHEYMTDTLTLPEPVTLRSAGSVADTDELNVEVDGVEKRRQTKRVGQVDLGSLSWYRDTQYANPLFYADFSDSPTLTGENYLAKCECALYKTVKVSSVVQTNKSIGIQKAYYYTAQRIVIRDDSYTDATTFKSAMSGVMLNYELASEVVTLLDPILDNFVKVEPNGTVETVQTQDPKVDGAMTITYTKKVTA